MYGDGMVKIYDSRGHDLFSDRTAALADIIKQCLPEAAKRLPAKYLKDNTGLAQLEGAEEEEY